MRRGRCCRDVAERLDLELRVPDVSGGFPSSRTAPSDDGRGRLQGSTRFSSLALSSVAPVLRDNQPGDVRRSRPDRPGRPGRPAAREWEAGADPGGRRRVARWGRDRDQRLSLARPGGADDGVSGRDRVRDADVRRGHERAAPSAGSCRGLRRGGRRGRGRGASGGAVRDRGRARDRNAPCRDLRAPAGERVGGDPAAGAGGAAACSRIRAR